MMNKTAKGALAAAVVLVTLVAVWEGISMSRHVDDQILIQDALSRSIEASKEGRPGGVMDLLSNNLKFNELDTSGNRSQIAKLIRDGRPEVEVENKTAVIRGDEATIESPVKLHMNFLGQPRDWNLTNVRLVFTKERIMRFLVIPSTQWKLSQVTIPANVAEEFLQQ